MLEGYYDNFTFINRNLLMHRTINLLFSIVFRRINILFAVVITYYFEFDNIDSRTTQLPILMFNWELYPS